MLVFLNLILVCVAFCEDSTGMSLNVYFFLIFHSRNFFFSLESGKHPILTTESLEVCSKLGEFCLLEKPWCCAGICTNVDFDAEAKFGRCIKY
jgi:hypothetical protein